VEAALLLGVGGERPHRRPGDSCGLPACALAASSAVDGVVDGAVDGEVNERVREVAESERAASVGGGGTTSWSEIYGGVFRKI
jgi:hypothetical protein